MVFRRLGKMAIQLSRASRAGLWWKGEIGSRPHSYTLEQMSKRRMTIGHHGPGTGIGGCWTGQGTGVVRGASGDAPAPEMQERG